MRVTVFAASQKQHGTSLNDGSQPPCSFAKDKNSMYFFHIMQNEMNVTNRFATNQKEPRIDTRPKKEARNMAG